ncbi:hypothetical protein COU57_01700 [Candidatus Pacearchaeota archaeon CG10_big_fil_rev_8_21_14_0_10_32_14]|nr:MAG: hypothetical protein COU57_01700 [Candidatus Pacearchaeota archaeon CG10_big_fil_rev_8_21_14_0_10_32_14]
MNEFLDYLLEYFDPKKIEVIESENETGNITPSGLIFILPRSDQIEQVVTLFHEVLHYHPKFISYSGGLLDGTYDRMERIEKQIDDMAYTLYGERKDLVELAERVIREAKRLYEDRDNRIEKFRKSQKDEVREFLKIRNRRRYGR